MDYLLTPHEAEKLLSRAFQVGFQRGLETSGKASKYMSQNKAWKMYGRGRVQGWVEAGLLQRKPAGNGKTSTVHYETAKLMELDTANVIVIRKSYTKEQ